MYNTWSRYALMAIFALCALASLYYNQYQLASVSALLFAFILWSHFKQGSVLMASKYFKNADYDKTEELLNEIQKGGEAFLSNAIVNQKYCLRACVVNFRTTKKDIEEIIEIIVRVGRKTHLKLSKA